MQNTSCFADAFAGRRVLVTGHTGFKGSWLCEWLLSLGARVGGLALAPPTRPALFDQLGLAGRLTHHLVDIRDAEKVRAVLENEQPEFLFHLAAQPLVIESYAKPVETFSVNVMGVVHLLDALRTARLERPVRCVVVTTDKCYENREWLHGYREDDPMGGYDPYSASKGMAELAVSAMRRSYFGPDQGAVRVATARAGNVIGGGDWSENRLVPDCVRALAAGEVVKVRNPASTRPWQHVLEPLGGYLALAAALDGPDGSRFATAFNFGPNLESNRTVADLVGEVLAHWPGTWQDASDAGAPHEAGKLNLSTDKAFHLLGWAPRWGFAKAVEKTVEWYRDPDPADATRGQIREYQPSTG